MFDTNDKQRINNFITKINEVELKDKNIKKNFKNYNLVIKLYKKYRANIKKNDKEFENKSADMNFTREQIIKHRESYNNMHETMLENIKKMEEITFQLE